MWHGTVSSRRRSPRQTVFVSVLSVSLSLSLSLALCASVLPLLSSSGSSAVVCWSRGACWCARWERSGRGRAGGWWRESWWRAPGGAAWLGSAGSGLARLPAAARRGPRPRRGQRRRAGSGSACGGPGAAQRPQRTAPARGRSAEHGSDARADHEPAHSPPRRRTDSRGPAGRRSGAGPQAGLRGAGARSSRRGRRAAGGPSPAARSGREAAAPAGARRPRPGRPPASESSPGMPGPSPREPPPPTAALWGWRGSRERSFEARWMSASQPAQLGGCESASPTRPLSRARRQAAGRGPSDARAQPGGAGRAWRHPWFFLT